MKPIIIKSTIWLHLLLFMGSLAFVATGIFIIKFIPEKQWAGWAGILFFGACALIGLWQLLDRRPRIIINDEGIYDRTLNISLIPWNEIEGAYKKSIEKSDFICLKLKDPQKYLPNLSGFLKEQLEKNLKQGFQPINLNLYGIHGKTDQILDLILKKSEEAKLSQHSEA